VKEYIKGGKITCIDPIFLFTHERNQTTHGHFFDKVNPTWYYDKSKIKKNQETESFTLIFLPAKTMIMQLMCV